MFLKNLFGSNKKRFSICAEDCNNNLRDGQKSKKRRRDKNTSLISVSGGRRQGAGFVRQDNKSM